MSLEQSCEAARQRAQAAWILCQQRGGKVKAACDAYHQVVKKKDTKNYDKARKALKDAIDSAREGYKTADKEIGLVEGIIDILEKKYGKDEVKKKCGDALKELKTAQDYRKDFKPIIDGAQKMYDKETL